MISFIVSALNEEQNIAQAVETIVAAAAATGLGEFEIILIDDGSTDNTHAVMLRLQKTYSFISIIRNAENCGMGMAIRQGIAAARYPKFMIVPGDSDMQQSLIEILLNSRGCAEIILTIPLNRESRSLVRNVVSIVYQLFQMIAFDIYVGYINGPGIWPTEKAKALGLNAKRFSIVSELNVVLLRTGCTYAEVPGYLHSRPKARGTVTLKNLIEVVSSFAKLVRRIHFCEKERFSARPKRIQVEFVPKQAAA